MHKACYQNSLKEREVRSQIFEHLESLSPGKVNYALVNKQLKTFTEEYGLTESGIMGTLVFMNNIQKIRNMPEKGIAFVPYKYQEAREFFERKARLSTEVEKVEDTVTQIEVIAPESKKVEKLLNLSDLIGE